ncbi:MAG: hypothetical protein JNK48_16895 [Bryobacterales bacterium]|nr:hypothetical protein [Bryobacterales bacterium]
MNFTLPAYIPYLVAVAALGATLFLFLEMKRMQNDFQTRWNKRQQLVQSELGKTRSQLQELVQRVEEAERRAETAGAPPSGLKSINLNRRSQAMRLFRRGESPAQVSATLGLPQCQAELLLKVQRILSGHATTPTAQN